MLSSKIKINYSLGFRRECDTNEIISANALSWVLIRKWALFAEMPIFETHELRLDDTYVVFEHI